MKIKIYSKSDVEKGLSNGDYLISILSTVETPLSNEIKSKYKKVLEIRFDDIQEEYEDMSLFNIDHEYTIKEFISNIYDWKSNETIDIHCRSGVSRSSSVALGVGCYFDDVEIIMSVIKDNKNIIPNEYILKHFIEKGGYWNWLIGYFRLKRKINSINKKDLEKLILHLGLEMNYYKFLVYKKEDEEEWYRLLEESDWD